MAFWLVLLISCGSLVLGHEHKHKDPLDLLSLEELLELQKAYRTELAVGSDDSDSSSDLFESSSVESEVSDSSDYSLEDSDDDDNDDDDDSEEEVGLQDKKGWIIYPEWSQWDPLGDDHSYHPVEPDTPVSSSAGHRERHRSRHRRPRRRRYHRSRRNYRRRRPSRERRIGRSRRERRSRRDYDDDYVSDEIAVGGLQDYLFDSDELALSADMPDYLFDYEDSSEEAVGAEDLFADDSVDFAEFERVPDSLDFNSEDEIALGESSDREWNRLLKHAHELLEAEDF